MSIIQLVGHKARVFGCDWSELVDGLIASTSDDQTVCVWNVDILDTTYYASGKTRVIEPTRKLLGHSSNVRAVCWSGEDENLLITGSWDSTIRVWNCVTGLCQV